MRLNLEVVIAKDRVEEIRKFATANYESRKKYVEGRRKQTNSKKNIRDATMGIIGEEGTKLILEKAKFKVSEVDLTHHKKKSFGADLVVDGNNIHVKTFYDKIKFSWLFERRDEITFKPQEKEFLALNGAEELDDGSVKVTLYYLVAQKDLVKNDLFTLPVVNMLKRGKTAIYAEDVYMKYDDTTRIGIDNINGINDNELTRRLK